jgi:hypothetical protein
VDLLWFLDESRGAWSEFLPNHGHSEVNEDPSLSLRAQ